MVGLNATRVYRSALSVESWSDRGLGARVLVGLVCLMALCQGQASADCAEAETNLASAPMAY